MALSDIAIKKIKIDTKPRKYADGEGLFLYVNTSGTKSWRFRYRNNPLADLKGVLKPHRTKHFPTITISEVPEFLVTLDKFKAAEIRKLAIKLLLLTFVRTKELRQARWEQFDFDKKLVY